MDFGTRYRVSHAWWLAIDAATRAMIHARTPAEGERWQRERDRLYAERDRAVDEGRMPPRPRRRLRNRLMRESRGEDFEHEHEEEEHVDHEENVDDEHEREHDGDEHGDKAEHQYDDVDFDDLPEILTIVEASELLDRAAKTVRNLTYNGTLTPVRRGRAVYVRTADVLALRDRLRGRS